MKKSKTRKLLDEASYYTNSASGGDGAGGPPGGDSQREAVPTLNKIDDLKNRNADTNAPQELAFPLQSAVQELADLYLKAQDLRNKARDAQQLPVYRGKEAELDEFKNKLNGIMVACKSLASSLRNFSLAPR